MLIKMIFFHYQKTAMTFPFSLSVLKAVSTVTILDIRRPIHFYALPSPYLIIKEISIIISYRRLSDAPFPVLYRGYTGFLEKKKPHDYWAQFSSGRRFTDPPTEKNSPLRKQDWINLNFLKYSSLTPSLFY